MSTSRRLAKKPPPFAMITADAMAILNRSKGPGPWKVYANLARHYNHNQLASWPSVPTIQRETGMPHGTVWDALNWLMDHGLIVRRRYLEGRSGQINVWDLPHLTTKAILDQKTGAKANTLARHWKDTVTHIQPKAAETINQGHLGKVMKDYGDEHGYDVVYRSIDVWVASQGTDFPKHLANGVMPDPVATYRTWLDGEGLDVTRSRLREQRRYSRYAQATL